MDNQPIEILSWRPRVVLSSVTILGIFSVLVFATGLRVTGPELSWDALDYAQVARQLVRTGEATSKFLVIVPDDFYSDRYNSNWPNLIRPRLPVAAIAFFFTLFGVSELTIVLWSAVFYVGTVIAIYLVFRTHFGDPYALSAAVIFAASKCGAQYARSGLTESAAMFFLVIALGLVPLSRTFVPFLSGLSIGLAWMIRPVAIAWALGLLFVFLFWRHRKRALFMTGGFAVVLITASAAGWNGNSAPLATNLAMRVGSPVEAYGGLVQFASEHAPAIAVKWVHEAARPLAYLFRFGEIPLFSAIAPFALFFTISRAQREIRDALIAVVGVNFLLLSALFSGDAFVGPLRYYDVFAPVALPFSVQLLHRSVTMLRLPKRMLWPICALFLAGLLFQSIRNPFRARGYSVGHAILADHVGKADVVTVTTRVNGPAVAWYSDRYVVLPPPGETTSYYRRHGISPVYRLQQSDEPLERPFVHRVADLPGCLVLLRR